MADGAQPQALRYSAFISYSRRDARFARSLHRQLEGYRLPRRGAAHPGSDRAPHARLRPIFRDEEEFCASYDLSGAVREAIAQSDFLIVVCSPNSAASKWVGLEIEDFRAVHGDSRILAALIEGDSSTAFHPALRGSKAITPLAADFRKGAGSHRLSLLKLVAPMAGVGLDELAQRDAHRRTRRIAGVAAGATLSLALVASLSLLTVSAQRDTSLQRDRGQSLIAYAVSDLSNDLRRAGRLDLLERSNEEALAYYQGQDLSQLTDEAQQSRAELLQKAGGDDLVQGEFDRARPRLVEAWRSTATLLARHPKDPAWMFAHAQSEYWVALLKLRTGDNEGARAGFQAYAALAQSLVAKDPTRFDWRHEVAYSELNLGMVALRQKGDSKSAERNFNVALAELQALAHQKPDEVDLQREVADAYAWLADSKRVGGDLQGAAAHRLAERRILENLTKRDPRNVLVRIDALGNELAMARIEAERGDTSQAIDRFERAEAVAFELHRAYPENSELGKQVRILQLFRLRTLLNLPPRERPEPETLRSILADCAPEEAPTADPELAAFCSVLGARIDAATGRSPALLEAQPSLPPSMRYGMYSPRWGISFSEELAAQRNAMANR